MLPRPQQTRAQPSRRRHAAWACAVPSSTPLVPRARGLPFLLDLPARAESCRLFVSSRSVVGGVNSVNVEFLESKAVAASGSMSNMYR